MPVVAWCGGVVVGDAVGGGGAVVRVCRWRLGVRGIHLRAPPLLLLAPSPPTPAAFPLSRISSSFVDPPSYANVAASSPRFASASPRSARAAMFEYSYITVSDPETETEVVATSLVPRPGSSYRAGGAAVVRRTSASH
ncbi:hypothetical protein D1007_44732 [Hordeum vulgare]|nr:hypothetical protein D1007_44732 [Hordeum vulgare]